MIDCSTLLQVDYLKIKQQHSTRLCPSDNFTSPNQSLFLAIYLTIKTHYGPTTSNEITTTPTSTSTSVQQTYFPIQFPAQSKTYLPTSNKSLHTKMQHFMQSSKNSYRSCHFRSKRIIPSFIKTRLSRQENLYLRNIL